LRVLLFSIPKPLSKLELLFLLSGLHLRSLAQESCGSLAEALRGMADLMRWVWCLFFLRYN
jgi:hypothetical protein